MSYKNIIDDTSMALQQLGTIGLLRRAGMDVIAVSISGISAQLTADVKEELWPVGGTRVVMEVPDTFTVVSSSAADTEVGTGCRTILIAGLDSDWNAQIEVIVLDGITPVVSTLQFRRVHRIVALTAGSGHKNAGAITLTETTGGTVQSFMTIGSGVSACAQYTIPAGYNGILIKAIYNFLQYRNN